MPLLVGFGQLEDELLHFFGMRDVVEGESSLFRGCLNVDVAVIEHRLEKSMHFGRGVLDGREMRFGCGSMKKAFLLNADDAFGRDNPRVEIIRDELLKRKKRKGEQVHGYEDDGEWSGGGMGENRWNAVEKRNSNDGRNQKEDETQQGDFKRDHPVAAQEQDKALIFCLVWEMVKMHHNPLKKGDSPGSDRSPIWMATDQS